MYKWNSFDLSPQTLVTNYLNKNEQYVLVNEYHNDLCDEEIKSFKDPIHNLEDLVEYKWSFYEKQQNDNYESITYTYEDKVLLVIDCVDDYDEELKMIILITATYFVIVTVIYGHPSVLTPYLHYYNSDGSGPDILANISVQDPKQIAQNLVHYYNQFLNDNYH